MKQILTVFIFCIYSIIGLCQGSSFHTIGVDSIDINKEFIHFEYVLKNPIDSTYLLVGDSKLFSANGKITPFLVKLRNDYYIDNATTFYTNDSKNFFVTGISFISYDTSYIITGRYNYEQGYLIKIDKNFEIMKSLIFDSLYISDIDIINNHYFINGSTEEGLIKDHKTDAVLIKMDTAFNVAWSKAYGGWRDDRFTKRLSTKDGGAIIFGEWSSVHNYPEAGFNATVLKIDSNGTHQWLYEYYIMDRPANSFLKAVETKDSGFVFWVSPQKNLEFFQSLLKIDKNGHVVWCKEYKIDKFYNPNFGAGSIIEVDNGDIISTSTIKDGDYFNGSILKTDSIGNPIWQRSYREPEPGLKTQFFDMINTFEGDLLVVGNALNNTHSFLYLFKTDTSGKTNCVNEQMIATWSEDKEVVAFPKDSVLDFNIQFTSFNVFKNEITPVFKNICIDTLVNIGLYTSHQNGIVFSPNPFTTTATIEINTEKAINNWQFALYNLLGEKVKALDNINTNRFEINRQGLANGIYLYRLQREGELLFSGKVLVSE